MVPFPTDDKSLFALFEFIAKHFTHVEEVPTYQDEHQGLSGFRGVLFGLRQDYYPTILDKATYLVISINKGHFFSNGNKRLSIATLVIYIGLQGKTFKTSGKDEYRILLSRTFPEREEKEWEDFHEFLPFEFALYHLAIEIARSGEYSIAHDDLKGRIRYFLEEAVL